MEKLGKNIATRIRSLLEPTAESLGLRIWDVEYVKEGTEMVLRITIDKENGVTIDDCELMHRTIDPLLDEVDLIENAYRLEVSSPGIERLLTRPEHFQESIGSLVEVRFFAPLNGRKSIEGILQAASDSEITVLPTNEQQPLTLSKSAVAKVQTLFDWSSIKEGK